jgi:hypothetical protein
MKSYCTQNNSDCSNCSLVNYGRDCQNNPIGRGGPGRGQGRKSKTGRKRQTATITVHGREIQLTGWMDDNERQIIEQRKDRQ